jgi:hypothetical protein
MKCQWSLLLNLICINEILSYCQGFTLRPNRRHIATTTNFPFQHRTTSTQHLSLYKGGSCLQHNDAIFDISNISHHRSDTLKSIFDPILVAFSVILTCCILHSTPVHAAPPFAVIAEELGYYPIMVPSSSGSNGRNSNSATTKGTIQYVPKRVQRTSTQQAIDLAHYIRTEQNVVLAGTYWCPHTTRQRELFGIEAWNELNIKEPNTKKQSLLKTMNSKNHGFTYIECAPQGYRGNPTICSNLNIDGYPTWLISTKETNTISNTARPTTGTTKRLSGERSLADIAEAVGYNTFDSALEETSNPPSLLGSSACKN